MPPARITLTVKPGSKDPGIAGDEDAFVLRVRERAVEGAANDACIKALARLLAVAPSRIELVRGATSRRKTFEIDGVNGEAVLQALRAASRF